MKTRTHPTEEFAIFLILFSGLALAFNFGDQSLLHLSATLGAALILYWFYSVFSSKHKNIWDTVITALIIFLIVDPGTELIDVALPLTATFLAMTQKFFLEIKGTPVTNPAVGSIIVAATLAAIIPALNFLDLSWWGLTFHPEMTLALMVVWLAFDFYKWKKGWAFLTFMITLLVLATAPGLGDELGIFTFSTAPLYFLGAIMLVDPKTSPASPNQQTIFGLTAAVIFVAFAFNTVPYAELFAIAGANLLNFGFKVKPNLFKL